MDKQSYYCGGDILIPHLSGDYETVDYQSSGFFILHNNTQNEDYPVHWHNAAEIIMPLKSDFTVSVSGKDYILEECDLLIIPPGELHSMTSQNGRRLIAQCDNSVLSTVSAISNIMPVFSNVICIDSDSDKKLRILAKKTMLDIYDEFYSGSELSETKIYIDLLTLLTSIRQEQLDRNENSSYPHSEKRLEYAEKINFVLKYIDKNYMYDLTLDTLAAVAGYSKFHFSRIFKQYSLVSYIKYINTKRTKAAELMLMSPEAPITEVAMQSGFSSITSFNRIFKEIKHCTPTQFKKMYIDNHAEKTDLLKGQL